jgi:NitT/TauT family transport system substrate-binding protein
MNLAKLILLAASLVLSVAPLHLRAQSQEKIMVRLDWSPWGMQAPFYLAKEKGWFQEAGLDVTLEDGKGTVNTIQIVGNSNQYDAGHVSLGSMMIARDKGLPLKALAVYMRASDIGLMVPTSSSITGPKDLKGKKIVFTPGSLEAPFIDAFLAAGGVKRNDIDLTGVDAASKVAVYYAGKADGVFSSIPFMVPAAEATKPSRGIRFSDTGLYFPSYGLVATEAKLKEKGPALKKLASITGAAWRYILNGKQDEAVQAMLKQRPQDKLDAKVIRGQIDLAAQFVDSPNSKGVPIGQNIGADWAQATKTLAGVGEIKRVLDPADYYSNDSFDLALYRKYSGGK